MFFFKEINTCILQGHIEFIKSDSKDIYNVDLYFKLMLFKIIFIKESWKKNLNILQNTKIY